MADFYSHVFNDIFNNCVSYFIRDFLNVRCTYEGNKKYCLFTYKKIFEETINVLNKSKYNGEIIMPKFVAFDPKHIFSVDDLIKTSNCFVKNKITVNNGVIKLKNAREMIKKDRIFLLPIDGIRSFAGGNSDFSMVIVLQSENKENTNVFDIKSILIFNPIRKDVFIFDNNDGCKYNEKKISFDKVYKESNIDVIFVKNAFQKNSFDLTKLSQIGELSFSNSIFSSLVELLTTEKNLCVYKMDENLSEFVEFAIKKSPLIMKKIGLYSIIGKEDAINRVIKQ
jgi:hypothetical protein